ncbi:tyrosine phosphatase family-domain-containing protein [Pseudomassariella vexata]|uniref:Tyrosine phosphatase family-domain-containing protein n=1 Tax=Pseudomassariella vexata TaxID=1141098 RepID=A0A1Y2E7Z2_9PEZI|nr:tyrosine phosphatase family-domain-containing protein [Pseudomassariella vexata]ORY67444.1 tyrosine phosphatase family-domain-containing protein [Pseudomassariella vexata]
MPETYPVAQSKPAHPNQESQLPSPPFLDIAGVPNFRDIGGYPIAGQDHKVVRRGVVFRSAEPSEKAADGAEQRRKLGIKQVFDLRSPRETGEGQGEHSYVRGPVQWEGAERYLASVLMDEDYTPEELKARTDNYIDEAPEGFAKAYQRILFAGSSKSNKGHKDQNGNIDPRPPYARILQHLASASSPPPKAILLHCSAGKDRTGVVCALILSLCGVADEVVAHEYSLTDLGLKERKSAIVNQLIQAAGPLFDNRKGTYRMLSSKKEGMSHFLEWIRATYNQAEFSEDAVEECVIKLGLLELKDIEQLRLNLVVDANDDTHKTINWQEHAELVHQTRQANPHMYGE